MSINPQILQLLTSRLSLNPAESEILQSGDYLQFFQQRMAADPSLATDPIMMALMGTITSAGVMAPESQDDKEPIKVRPIEVPDDDGVESEAIAALRYVAQILGACHCWGQNEDCLDCHGRGEPGYRRSHDPATFVAWVRPGLQRIGLRLVRVESSPRFRKPEN